MSPKSDDAIFRKTKILYLITKGNFGGAQRYVYDLAKNLSKEKYEIVVGFGDQDGDVLETKLKEIGIKTIKLEGSGREVQAKSDLNLLRQIVKIIKEESPNIVHLNSSKVGFVGTIAKFFIKIENIFSFVTKKHYKIPTFVFTSHGWAFNENKRGVIWRSIYLLCYYVIIFGCEKIIAVSEKTKNDILLNKTIKEKIKVIYNGIEKFELLKREDPKNILK